MFLVFISRPITLPYVSVRDNRRTMRINCLITHGAVHAAPHPTKTLRYGTYLSLMTARESENTTRNQHRLNRTQLIHRPPRPDLNRQWLGLTSHQPQTPRISDHRPVVGTKLNARIKQLTTLLFHHRLQRCT